MKSVLLKQFTHLDDILLKSAINEFYRYAQLAIWFGQSQFIPVDELCDSIWHCHILETKEYRALCTKIKPGAFLDHEGINFQDYQNFRSADEIRGEDLEWLGKYHRHFGKFTSGSVKHWVIPKYLITEVAWPLDKINALSAALAITFEKEDQIENYQI